MGVSHGLSSFCNTVESGCGQMSSNSLRHLLLPWESAVVPLRQPQPALQHYNTVIISHLPWAKQASASLYYTVALSVADTGCKT